MKKYGSKEESGGGRGSRPGRAAKRRRGHERAENGETGVVGPQLPSGRLKTNTIFEGDTREQIIASPELAEVMKRYPLVKNMLVPVSKLAEAKQKIAAGGNALHKFYADIASQAAAEGLEG